MLFNFFIVVSNSFLMMHMRQKSWLTLPLELVLLLKSNVTSHSTQSTSTLGCFATYTYIFQPWPIHPLIYCSPFNLLSAIWYLAKVSCSLLGPDPMSVHHSLCCKLLQTWRTLFHTHLIIPALPTVHFDSPIYFGKVSKINLTFEDFCEVFLDYRGVCVCVPMFKR